MDYKKETKKSYEQYASRYEEMFRDHFSMHVRPEADRFLKNLPGKDILDLGAGPGNHAEYFRDQGYRVLCVDISPQMVRLCQEKGLKAKQMDIEKLRLPPKSFDGVWAYASILHIPKKKIPGILRGLAKLLRPQGSLFLGVKEGKGERFETRQHYPGAKRWFSYFTDEEIRTLIKGNFETVYFGKTRAGHKSDFLHYLLRLK